MLNGEKTSELNRESRVMNDRRWILFFIHHFAFRNPPLRPAGVPVGLLHSLHGGSDETHEQGFRS